MSFLQSIYPTIPPDIEPWLYFLCVGTAVLITGVSKAGFGGGIGILAIPLTALATGSHKMLGLTLPVLIACDIFSNLHYIGDQDWPRLRPLLWGAIVGVGIGTGILIGLQSMVPADFGNVMNLIVGVICFLVVLGQAYRLSGRELPTLPAHPASGFGVGALAGCVSTINHAAGPIVTVYLLQEKLPKKLMVGTLLMYFLLINTAKVPSYVVLGFITKETLLDSLWFLPLIPIGTLLGAWMNKKMTDKWFNIIMYTATAITAAFMIYKSAMHFAYPPAAQTQPTATQPLDTQPATAPR